MSTLRIFNEGRGFVANYNYSVSGLRTHGGCSFGCTMCYAAEYIKKSIKEFQRGGSSAKVTLAQWATAVSDQVHQSSGKTVYANTMTDPCQPSTLPYTKVLLEQMLGCLLGPPKLLVLQTRSPLVLQLLPILKRFGDKVRVNLTIDTDDEKVRKLIAPQSPGISARFAAAQQLDDAGIPWTLTWTPSLPLADVDAWCNRINRFKHLTHVVCQEFEDNSDGGVGTSREGEDALHRNFPQWFRGQGYRQTKLQLEKTLNVPLIEGQPGFAPFPKLSPKAIK